MLRLNSKTKPDPTGPVFIGMDVHKRKYSISFIHCGEFIRRVIIDGSEEAVLKLLKNYNRFELYSVYEAGFCGFHLHYYLESLGVHNTVVATNSLPVIQGDKVKRDSLKLASFLAKGLLKSINIPIKEVLNLRQML